MLSASPCRFSSHSPQYQNWKANKDSILTVPELGLQVKKSWTRISKDFASTDAEHKFSKTEIENWLPIDSIWVLLDCEPGVITSTICWTANKESLKALYIHPWSFGIILETFHFPETRCKCSQILHQSLRTALTSNGTVLTCVTNSRAVICKICMSRYSPCSGILVKIIPRKHINVKLTLKQRWLSTFISVLSTMIFGWKWTLIQRTFIGVFSTLAKRRWKNYVDSMLMNQCCSNVEIWLKIKVEPTYVYRRCFNVDKTMLKQHWQNYVDSTSITQCCFKVNS